MKMIVFDMDSMSIDAETIDEPAAAAGVGDRVAEIVRIIELMQENTCGLWGPVLQRMPCTRCRGFRMGRSAAGAELFMQGIRVPICVCLCDVFIPKKK